MTIYLAMDDTDNIDSRGTGKLSRDVAKALSKKYPIKTVTRHQLFFHEDIPFTSHNSCAVIHIDLDLKDKDTQGTELKKIFDLAKKEMLDDFIEGSDPGIAVADSSQIDASLILFGKDAKERIVTQGRARALARNLGILLEGLGGSEDGVIGAMAGIGLAFTGNDGRVLQVGSIRDLTGPQKAETLLGAGIDKIISIEGRLITTGIIDCEKGKSAKASPINGKAVLFVDETSTSLKSVKRK
ncbi:MAG: ABC transporter substrate-binding protein [Methanobacteriaceae archaeon]